MGSTGLSTFHLDNQDGQAVLRVEGDWTVKTVGRLDRELNRTRFERSPEMLDVSGLGDVDTAAMARLMAGVGRDFSRAEVVASLRSSPKDSANQALDVILHGLTAPRAGPTK